MTVARGLPVAESGWPAGTYATPEVTTGGVALLDYDSDGRLDIYQVRCGRPGQFDEPVQCRLFHQESDGSFKEIADAGGANATGYGIGVAVGDYDNDGHPDLYVTYFGQNHLYHNGGPRDFTDVTEQAGLLNENQAEKLWSSSATWFDYDRDGKLDLYVAHFAAFDPSRKCLTEDNKPEYCGPAQFRGVVDSLYHNNGDGTFTDVAAQAGINYPGRGWGVVCGNFSGEGGPDIFVANDAERQNLWVNRHDGTFKDEALERGVAFNGAGKSEAGMGVAVGDIANDGRLSLFITHIRNEKNTLYEPTPARAVERAITYADKSAAAGMAAIDLPYTGWGCGFFDFDNDGNLDVAVANGRVSRGQVSSKADVSQLGAFWSAYAEPNLLFRGDGRGHFADATGRGGDFTAHAANSRGLAFGDIDNDGLVDLVANTLDNTLSVYRNVAASEGNHWLTIRVLVGNRDAYDARLELTAVEKTWTRLALAGYSFASSNDPRVHFGLGKVQELDSLSVLWPDGKREVFDVPGIDRQLTIRQGEGRAATR